MAVDCRRRHPVHAVILCTLSWKDIQNTAAKNNKSSKVLSARLAANYETVSGFPAEVEAGPDNCTGQSHAEQFLWGYLGNSQELWLQTKLVQGHTGLPP